MGFFKGNKHSYFVVLSANIVAFLSGTSLAWSSPVLAILQGEDLSKIPLKRQITNDESSWIGALAAMGGIFGPFIYVFLVNKVGRKMSVAAISVPFLIGYLIAAFAEVVELYYVARILMGIGVAATFSTVPIYVVETAEDVNRGLLQGLTTTCIMLGILFSYCVGPYASIMVFNLILAAICLLFVPIFWYIAPETSYYLIATDREKQAFATLQYLRRRPDDEIFKELDGIKSHLKDIKPGSVMDIFTTRASLKGFLYAIALTTFQQFSGVLCILYFTQNIFNSSGSDLAPEVCSIIVGSAQLCVSIVSPMFLDRAGRRMMLFIAVSGSIIAETLLGIYFYLQKNGDDVSNISWLPVFSLVMFIVFYNLGMGSIPWAVMSEILSLNIITKAAALVTSFYWLTGFFLTYYFGTLSEAIGMGGSFWLFAGCLVLYDVFIAVFMFETKGKSLTEIQAILNK